MLARSKRPLPKHPLTPPGARHFGRRRLSHYQFGRKSAGDVTLTGTIGLFPVELHLTVKIDGDTVTVTLEVDKPIHLGPFTWTFKLGGVSRDAKRESHWRHDDQPLAGYRGV